MVNPKLNSLVNVLMFVLLIITGISTFTRSELHKTAGIILIILIIIHILFHYKQIMFMTKNLFKK